MYLRPSAREHKQCMHAKQSISRVERADPSKEVHEPIARFLIYIEPGKAKFGVLLFNPASFKHCCKGVATESLYSTAVPDINNIGGCL